MRIVHASDWHGSFSDRLLPPADVYVITGDWLPNFIRLRFKNPIKGTVSFWNVNMHLIRDGVEPRPDLADPHCYFDGRIVDDDWEEERQKELIAKLAPSFRKDHLASPDAPVVVCRGNHDFTDLAPLFGGEVYEIGEDPTWHEVRGVVFGGFRGINYIAGEWSDELFPESWEHRAARLSDRIDVLVTHAPPYGVLDWHDGEHLGATALIRYIQKRTSSSGSTPLRAHCFGHIHEQMGSVRIEDVMFSNAATAFNEFDVT